MQIHGHELTVHRGEAFTIYKVLQNRDRTPYIISNELVNAYFLLTITDTLYEQSKRYVKDYWLRINDTLPMFDLTVPIHINTLKKNADGNNAYESISEITSFPVSCYVDGKLVSISDRYAVFYDDEGVYKYWDNGWKNYQCRIVKTISTEDTSGWSASNYLYSIRLVAGERGIEGLSNIQNSVPILSPTKIKVINA